jgi:hypothetical protein
VTPRINALENNTGVSAIHAAKQFCPMCCGGYSFDSQGRRICIACTKKRRHEKYIVSRTTTLAAQKKRWAEDDKWRERRLAYQKIKRTVA